MPCGPLVNRAFFNDKKIDPNALISKLPMTYNPISQEFMAKSTDRDLMGKEFEYRIEAGFANYQDFD